MTRKLDARQSSLLVAASMMFTSALVVAAPPAGRPLGAVSHDLAKKQAWFVRTDVLIDTKPNQSQNPTAAADLIRLALPVLPQTSTMLDEPSIRRCVLVTASGGRDREPEFMPSDDGMTQLAVCEAGVKAGGEVRFQLNVGVLSVATRIDERLARQYDWPKADWSSELLPYLEAQPLVDSDAPAVQSMLQSWTKGNERKARPYVLAKFIASKMMEEVQIDTDPSRSTSTRASGHRAEKDEAAPQGALSTATSKSGNALDAACLLTALYRAAGLPARLVIAFDHAAPMRLANGSVPDMTMTADPTIARDICFSGSPEADAFPTTIRAWTEFFVASDPGPGHADGVQMAHGEWIPVDIAAQISSSPQPPPQDQPWLFFGNHPDADEFVPIAFHWNADTGSPTPGAGSWFWNWVGRHHPEVTQALVQVSAQRVNSRGK